MGTKYSSTVTLLSVPGYTVSAIVPGTLHSEYRATVLEYLNTD